jgi:phosphomannomutase
MPVYSILKDREECSTEKAHFVVRELVKRFSDQAITTIDGVKVDYAESWIHIRPSNTEPILRLTAEARSVEEAQRLLEDAKGEIRGILSAT